MRTADSEYSGGYSPSFDRIGDAPLLNGAGIGASIIAVP